MKHIGRLPLTGDEYVIEVRLGLTVAVFLAVQLPIIGPLILRVIDGFF